MSVYTTMFIEQKTRMTIKQHSLWRMQGTKHAPFSIPSLVCVYFQRSIRLYKKTNEKPLTRQPVRRPFHLSRTPHHILTHTDGPFLQSSAPLITNQSNETAFEAEDDDALESEALKGDYSLPTTSVKSASPNCKRISPPHSGFNTSPGWRSCRKLILRSIPSLTFTPEKENMELPGKLQWNKLKDIVSLRNDWLILFQPWKYPRLTVDFFVLLMLFSQIILLSSVLYKMFCSLYFIVAMFLCTP